MQSEPVPPSPATLSSQITIKFGDIQPPCSGTGSSPLNITLSADYCSPKVENKRFNAG